MSHGGDLCHTTAKIVTDQDGAFDADLSEPGDEIFRLLPNRDVTAMTLRDRGAIADHFPRQCPGALQAWRDVPPQLRAGRYPMDQHHRLSGSSFFPAHLNAVDPHSS